MSPSLLEAFPMPNHPRPTRMQRGGAIEHKNGGSWTKQPRPLEDGNWVCDDPHCNNVNYPRRTQCHKCGKKRGPVGDAVVRAYLDSLRTKIATGDYHPSQPVKMPFLMHPEHIAMAWRMFPSNGLQVYHHQQRTAPKSNEFNFTADFEPWMRGPPPPPPTPLGAQYIPAHRATPFPGRRPFLSIATEGKRLAEHLVASFAASPDPVGDSGECLASAALWLRNMKSRLREEKAIHAGTPSMAAGLPTFTGIPLGNGNEGTEHAGNSTPKMAHHSISKFGNIAVGPRAMQQLPHFGWKDFKDFSYLEVMSTASFAMDQGNSTEGTEENLSWECLDCHNVNFQGRKTCLYCNNSRDAHGGGGGDDDELVSKYVDSLLEDSEEDDDVSTVTLP